MTLDAHAPLSKSTAVVATEVDGEMVLISSETGQYVGLDEIGSAIWSCLREPRTIAELCAQLQADYDGDSETIARETTAFVEQLIALRLVDAGRIASPESSLGG